MRRVVAGREGARAAHLAGIDVRTAWCRHSYRYDVHDEQIGGLWVGASTSNRAPRSGTRRATLLAGTPSTSHNTAVCAGLRILTQAQTRLHRVWTHPTLVGLCQGRA
jgi:hypothetical protein